MKTDWRKLIDDWFDNSDTASVLLEPLLGPRLWISDEDRDRLLSVSATPLYVFRAASELDYIVLTLLLRRLGLPVPRVHHPSFLLVPSATRWFDKVVGRVLPDRQNAVSHAVSRVMRGQCAYVALFAHDPASESAEPLGEPFFANLLAEMRASVGEDRPLTLVPVVLIWNKKGVRSDDEPRLLRRLLGDPEIPGRLRALVQAASSLGRPSVKVGEPLDLQAWQQLFADRLPSDAASLLVRELDERIENEWRLQLGPKLRPFSAIQRELARNPEVVAAYYQAIRDGMPPRQARKELREALEEIPAAPATWTLSMYKGVLRIVWERMFRGFDVDHAGFSAMRDAAHRGPLLLLPCHRSHMDYLILSWLMERYDLPIPHIAAGKNLSFWPMGPIFRRGGAFFIRRSFKGNKLYKTILLEYLAMLIRSGVNVEFFPEGTRSRTGKAVYPRTGLLAMIAELVATGRVPSPQVVPIAVGYEKVVEEDAYLREMEGRPKEDENLGQLMKAAFVLLERYGRVNVQVAPPFDMAEFLGPLDPASDAFKQRVEQLGLRVIADIVSVSVVTPTMLTAAALLATGENVCALADVEERFRFFRELAIACGVRLSRKLTEETMWRRAFSDSLRYLSSSIQMQGARVLILQKRRGTLAYYRNGFSQTVVQACVHAADIHAPARGRVRGQDLRAWLRREFPQFAMETPPKLPEEAVRFVGGLNAVQNGWILSLVADIVESQKLVCERLALLVRDKTAERRWTARQIVQEVRAHGKTQLRKAQLARAESLAAQGIAETVEWLVEEGLLARDESGKAWRFALEPDAAAAAFHRQARLRHIWLEHVRRLLAANAPR